VALIEQQAVSAEYKIKLVLEALKQHQLLPKKIEFANYQGITFSNVYNSLSANIIHESVFVGVDTSKDIALLKALVEYVERLAFLEGAKKNLQSCATKRSDGFAAFPHDCDSFYIAKKLARENAYNEALERFVWAVWWDSMSSATTIDYLTQPQSTESKKLIDACAEVINFNRIYLIKPKHTDGDCEVCIFFVELENGGFISGGAAELKCKEQRAHIRALSELLRHGLAAQKLLNTQELQNLTFYEKRLLKFASGEASKKVWGRLNSQSSTQIKLPELEIDTTVPHSLDSSVVVHRCLFKEQPPFIGGDLDRLCL
jgi:ribosomal protein S12 methylthiotransferase accessory factor YcaO